METTKKVAHSSPAFVKVSNSAFIKISKDRQDGIIQNIECEYTILIADKEESDKYFRFYIPAFDISYFSDKEEDAKRMADVAVSTFFDYWTKVRGNDAFIDQIKKLGFTLDRPKVKQIKQMRFIINKPSLPPAYEVAELFRAKQSYSAA